MKLVIVATNLNRDKFWKRWIYLKNIYHDIDITILAPQYYESGTRKEYTFGEKECFVGTKYEEERFKVRPIRVKQHRLGDWTSIDIKRFIGEEIPDFVYYIGTHNSRALTQVVFASRKVGAKVLVFTMRGDLEKARPASLKHKLIQVFNNFINEYNVSHSDGIFVHYPDAITAFRKEGYKGPIYINTQIGVDTSHFRFSKEGRDRIRKKFGLESCFVFGGASRFNAEKGILDAIEALPVNNNVKYMILGSGTEAEYQEIRKCAEKCGVSSQIVMPGLISWAELPDYLSAMDCAVHVPRRTANWVETFSLALVQEMSVSLPVIGSRSGSVPYQIGMDELLVDEGNIDQIHEKMRWILENREKASVIGKKMRDRCINCFDVEHIAKCFGIVLHELAEGKYNTKHIDTAIRWEK